MFDFNAIKDVATTLQAAQQTLDLRLSQILDVLIEIRDQGSRGDNVVDVTPPQQQRNYDDTSRGYDAKDVIAEMASVAPNGDSWSNYDENDPSSNG